MKQQDVGPALTRLREARGLSVAELAERCRDVSPQQVRRAEKDSRPLVDTLGRLLEGLDANLCDLHSAIVDPQWQPPPPASDAAPLPSLLTRPELVGMAVQLLRRRANLTLQNLGDLLGMSKSGAGDIEKGSNFRLSSFERVLEVLEASLLDFHEALQMAHFVTAWQQKQDDETALLRGGLLSLQLPHLGSRDEGETAAALRSLRQRVPPRTS